MSNAIYRWRIKSKNKKPASWAARAAGVGDADSRLTRAPTEHTCAHAHMRTRARMSFFSLLTSRRQTEHDAGFARCQAAAARAAQEAAAAVEEPGGGGEGGGEGTAAAGGTVKAERTQDADAKKKLSELKSKRKRLQSPQPREVKARLRPAAHPPHVSACAARTEVLSRVKPKPRRLLNF